jgi:hypothetical protein
MRMLLCAMLFAFTVTPARTPAKGAPSPAPLPTASPQATRLLSPRAVRRARLLIELRLLELREERLDCVREVILRRLPPDLRPTGSLGGRVKHSAASRSIKGSEDCAWTSMPPRLPTATD